jgi:hypothetical protein
LPADRGQVVCPEAHSVSCSAVWFYLPFVVCMRDGGLSGAGLHPAQRLLTCTRSPALLCGITLPAPWILAGKGTCTVRVAASPGLNSEAQMMTSGA